MPKKNNELPLLPLFHKFIYEMKKGKHLQRNGKRIKPSTILNYIGIEKLLINFSLSKEFPLRFKPATGIKKKRI